ncbi:heterogeneous nuclear ribonucleoproteins A1 homolog [Paramacrobiotus metropolitanus]|uniref:heterogeneous nuclear ribonucleoproteins A1 homolog n=1 Tax=Paramacrobiotus metropolitanus TaxID=2943436 RepID=UPI002445B1D0|nr:heterogeneous nuclear ribonucleoproteins A1 homolog [Paramacrobiotus metropolitanus]
MMFRLSSHWNAFLLYLFAFLGTILAYGEGPMGMNSYGGGGSMGGYGGGGAMGSYSGGGNGYGGPYSNYGDDGGWMDVGKLDWGPVSPVPYWPLPFLPPAWPLFPNRDFAYGYYPFPFTWGFPGYSRGFYGGFGRSGY